MDTKRKKPRKHGRRYPWQKWFDCKRFRLNRGEHFDIRPDSMAQVARQAARRMPRPPTLSITVRESFIVITVKERASA